MDTAAAGELLVWRRLTGQPTQDRCATVQLTGLLDVLGLAAPRFWQFPRRGPVDDGSSRARDPSWWTNSATICSIWKKIVSRSNYFSFTRVGRPMERFHLLRLRYDVSRTLDAYQIDSTAKFRQAWDEGPGDAFLTQSWFDDF